MIKGLLLVFTAVGFVVPNVFLACSSPRKASSNFPLSTPR